MKIMPHIPVIAALLVLAGCGSPFLHPAISASTVPDPGLVGEWVSTGATRTKAEISQPSSEVLALSLVVHHEGEFKTALTIDLKLTEIEGVRYADLFLSRAERDKLVGAYGFLVLPVHQIMKIQRDGDELRLWSFDGSWLDSNANDNRFGHDRVQIGGGEVTLVTAPTDQLRDVLAKSRAHPDAFGEPLVFHRVRS